MKFTEAQLAVGQHIGIVPGDRQETVIRRLVMMVAALEDRVRELEHERVLAGGVVSERAPYKSQGGPRRPQRIKPAQLPLRAVVVKPKPIKSIGRQADRHWDPVTGRKK